MKKPIMKKHFFKIILFSNFVIINNFHKQHKCNNRITNNSINICSFCFLFTPSFLKVFLCIDVMLEPKKNGPHQGSTSRPRAQRTDVHCSRVWRPLGYPCAPIMKKHRWCDRESNREPREMKDGRGRQIHWAMLAPRHLNVSEIFQYAS